MLTQKKWTISVILGLTMVFFAFVTFNSKKFFEQCFFQHNSYGLVNIYFTDVPETSLRYILVYPFNYVYVFDKQTHVLKQPYLKGNSNILCKDPEHYSTVVQFDWTNLSSTPEKLKLTCELNMYEQVYHYVTRLPKSSITQIAVPQTMTFQTYGSIELINVLIKMGVIVLERVSH